MQDVLLPVESILDGTWGSGDPPDEYRDFTIMSEMNWSWSELQETPKYVRRYVWDFLQAKWAAEAARNKS